jgi:peptide/nickel transport system permease protein
MGSFLVRRFGAALVTLVFGSIAVFFGVRALPGDPATVMAGESSTPEMIAEINHQYGFDKPLPVQYVTWLGQLLRGNFGMSTQYRVPVADLVAERLPVTMELALLAMIVGLLIGITAGVVSAVKPGSVRDYAANGFGLFGLSVPHFWLGLLAILVFAVTLHWLPASGFVGLAEDPGENLRRMVMPVLVLGTGLSAVIMRQTRSALIGQLSADYVRTARSKGVPHRTEVTHALRNSLTTLTTIVGLQLAGLISGAVITEEIFVIPGFGHLIVNAVANRDYPAVQTAVLVTVAGYVVVNFLVDVAYAYLNPRLRVTGETE